MKTFKDENKWGLDSEAGVTCGNCQWEGDFGELQCQLDEIPDLAERLDPGSEVPAGECPECGCLCYLDKKPAYIVGVPNKHHE